MKKGSWLTLFLLAIACSLGIYSISLSGEVSRTIAFIPSDVTGYFYSFLDVLQDHPKDAAEYCHFETEHEEEAYRRSNVHVLSYELLGAQKINDDLYAFTIHLEKEFDTYPKRYYFVGRIDGKLRMMVNAGNIPETLKDNFDAEAFTLTTKDFGIDIPVTSNTSIN